MLFSGARPRYMTLPNRPQHAGAILLITLTLVAHGQGRPAAQDHDHASGGTFGSVHFETSCSPAAQAQFDRAVAMLHSFFYPETEKAFRAIASIQSRSRGVRAFAARARWIASQPCCNNCGGNGAVSGLGR